MKKILVVVCLLLLFGCGTITTKENTESNTEEMQEKNKKGKEYIKNDTVYFEKSDINSKPMKLNMFETIEESVYNQEDEAQFGYKGQKIDNLIHKFEYKDNYMRIIFTSKDKYSRRIKINVKYLYHNPKTGKYSDIMSSEEPIRLESYRSIMEDLDKNHLIMRSINNEDLLTILKEPNQLFGYTTEKDELNKLTIEGYKPDGIKRFSIKGNEYYFWYYNDIKSNKNMSDYVVKY